MYLLGLFALFLFVLGFGASYIVDKLNLSMFRVFPIWFLKFTMKYADPNRNFISIFLFIFLFNSSAICLYMLSGLLVVFPVVIAFLTGMNIGIIVLSPIPEELRGSTFVHPRKEIEVGLLDAFMVSLVPLLELFVFCYALAMGMQIALSMRENFTWGNIIAAALPKILAYFSFCVPILFVSAWIETTAIKRFTGRV